MPKNGVNPCCFIRDGIVTEFVDFLLFFKEKLGFLTENTGKIPGAGLISGAAA